MRFSRTRRSPGQSMARIPPGQWRWRDIQAVEVSDRGHERPPQVGDRSPSSQPTLRPPPHTRLQGLRSGRLCCPYPSSLLLPALTSAARQTVSWVALIGLASYRAPQAGKPAASMPVRRRISPVPCSTVQTFRSPYAEGFLGAALPSSSPRPWPSPCGARLGSLFVPPRRGPLRRGRIRLMLRTACSLDSKRVFVVTLQRFGSLLALATSYTAAWSLR